MIDFLRRRWFLILLLGGAGGALVRPDLADPWMRPIDTKYVTAITMFLSSFGLDARRFWDSLKRPAPILLALAMGHIVAPILCFGVAQTLLPEQFRIGLLIVGAIPATTASCILWTRLAGGNEAAALVASLISNLSVFVVTAGWLSLLFGTDRSIDFTALVGGLILYAALPVVVGQAVRLAPSIAAWADRKRRRLGLVNQFFILWIVIKATIHAAPSLNGQEWSIDFAGTILLTCAVCLGVHWTLLQLGFGLGQRLMSREDAIAVAFTGGQKTMFTGAYLIEDYFPEAPLAMAPLIFFHIGQLVIDTFVAERWFYTGAKQPPADSSPSTSDPAGQSS